MDLVATYESDPISYINNYVGEGGKVIRIGLEGDDKKNYLKKHREPSQVNIRKIVSMNAAKRIRQLKNKRNTRASQKVIQII